MTPVVGFLPSVRHMRKTQMGLWVPGSCRSLERKELFVLALSFIFFLPIKQVEKINTCPTSYLKLDTLLLNLYKLGFRI